VRRWTKSVGGRRPVPCSIALRNYNLLMGAVDAFNRELAATHKGMRCRRSLYVLGDFLKEGDPLGVRVG
jgi:hypothetical protein